MEPLDDRWIAREMYRSVKLTSYNRGEGNMYMARIKLVSGERIDLPFECEGKMTPHNFIIHFLLYHIFYPREILLLEIYQHRIYCESYVPRTGWFKKGEEREAFP